MREPVPPQIIFKALERMRNAARDNGVDPDSIMLHSFDGEVIDFGAKSLFEIKATVAQKSMPGRESGEVCGSAADLHGRIRQATEKTTIDIGIIDFATEFLKRRKDKGFMVEGAGLKLERLGRTLLFYNSCTNCTAGKINCMACQGGGLINCARCRGHRTIVCPQCRGARTIKDQSGHVGPCRKCNGHGDTACAACHSSGKIKCKSCVGTGQAKCPRCNATGIISDMAYVSFEAKTHFLYDRDALPQGLPALIDRLGPQVALQNHADVEILKEKEQRAAQMEHETAERAPVHDELVVPFRVRVPWGQIAFRVEGKVMKGHLFGLHPRLLNIAPFLDKALGPGLDRLTQAAHGLGHVWSNIHEAIRFRIIADAMVSASAQTPKKAVLSMRKRWSVGVSRDLTDKMTLLADQAYRNISKLPRVSGLALGLVFAAGVDAAYVIGPLRGMIVLKGAPSVAMIVFDAALIAGTGFMAEAMSRLVTKHALRHLFVKLLPPGQLHKIKPKSGSVGFYAYGGAAIVFAGIVALAAISGYPVPDWAVLILAKVR